MKKSTIFPCLLALNSLFSCKTVDSSTVKGVKAVNEVAEQTENLYCAPFSSTQSRLATFEGKRTVETLQGQPIIDRPMGIEECHEVLVNSKDGLYCTPRMGDGYYYLYNARIGFHVGEKANKETCFDLVKNSTPEYYCKPGHKRTKENSYVVNRKIGSVSIQGQAMYMHAVPNEVCLAIIKASSSKRSCEPLNDTHSWVFDIENKTQIGDAIPYEECIAKIKN